MNNSFKTKEEITDILLSSLPFEENNSGYNSLERSKYDQVFPLIVSQIRNGDTEFVIDLKNKFKDIDFEIYSKDEIVEEHRYIKQGGGDLFTYIKLKLEMIPEPVLIISEELPEYLRELLEEDIPKSKCSEWMAVYPYILKAIIDYFLTQKTMGVRVTLLDIRFHPVDFKPYAYYVCARRLLAKCGEE